MSRWGGAEDRLSISVAFFRMESECLSRLAARKGLRPADVDEVVAQAWRCACENGKLFRGPDGEEKLRPWLRLVVCRRAVDRVRRLRRRRCQPLPCGKSEPIDEAEREFAKGAVWAEYVQSLLNRVRGEDETNTCLLAQYYLHGRSHKELAASHGLSPKAIERRIARTLQKLRRLAAIDFGDGTLREI